MGRWGVGWIIALLWAGLILVNRSTSNGLLYDTDTKVMLQRIEARGDHWSWWKGDWPLENRFYRPVVAETFELDLAVHGRNPHGYAITNAILCGVCLLGLFWFLRELTGNVSVSTLAVSFFGFWHIYANPPPWFGWVIKLGLLVSASTLVVNLVQRIRPAWPAAFALGVFVLLEKEGAPLEPFRGGMIEWIPGRTASTMTLFCLIAMAAYARYERLSARRIEPDPGPLDPPATRGTELRVVSRWPWVWALIAALSVFLALASYEQAVMLPACLIGVAIAMRLQHHRVRWAWTLTFWGVLVGYFLFRAQIIPAGTSSYQAQQFRTGPGVYISLADYLFPSTAEVVGLAAGADLGLAAVMVAQYGDILAILANLVLLAGLFVWSRSQFARKERNRVVAVLFGLAASLVAFLPMAWMKPFAAYNHYHYWPLALRSVYVAALVFLAAEWLSAAWSRRALQAPPRPSPAQGSLPRP